LLQYLHIFTYFASYYLSIDLRGAYGFMPQHGAHGFQWYTVGQCNGGGKGVPRGVRSKILIYA